MNILFFEPIARPAIWGNKLVKNYFGYDQMPDGTGQAWAFSCDPKGSNVCLSEPFKGRTLKDLWNNEHDVFGGDSGEFPVIISLVGPEDDLSIQVHPDSAHAIPLGAKYGKNEAWYFIESEEGANIVYGHNAKDENDLREYIKNDKWDELINHKDVHTDGFVYIPAGTLHACRKGSVVYEIQQSTDITYRFYDYHRKDANGNERELHLEPAIACLNYDHEIKEQDGFPVESCLENGKKVQYISNDSFTITKYEINGLNNLHFDSWVLATVCKGEGKANGYDVKVGSNFLIPANSDVSLDGNMLIMTTSR